MCRDGESHNLTWNCGAEGPTKDVGVQRLRARQQRNLAAALLLSQGVPMILMGDEYGHSKVGVCYQVRHIASTSQRHAKGGHAYQSQNLQTPCH
jgi:1,4-alpha-glucan branching enzyme